MVLSMQFALSRQAKNRGGSFIVESVVAVLLLGTASLALMKLAHSSSRLRQRADRELSAVLTAQNAMTRLRAVDADQISQRLGEIEEACERDSGCQVELIATPFERPPVAGVHLRVEVSVNHDSRVTLHDWKVMAPEASPAKQPAAGETNGTDRPPSEGDE